MNYNQFHIANRQYKTAIKFVITRAFGIAVYSAAMSVVLLIIAGRTAIQSGRTFRQQFNQGYSGLDGSFCPLTCGFSCELPEVPAPVLEASEAVLDASEVVSKIAYDDIKNLVKAMQNHGYMLCYREQMRINRQNNAPAPMIDLGEWYLNSKGVPYTRKCDIVKAYRKAVANV